MGQHKGWRTRQRGTRWQGLAWDPHRQREVARSFGRQSDASSWAREEHARLRAGVARSRRRCETRAVIDAYQVSLERRQCSEGHRELVAQRLGSLAAAVPDLDHPRTQLHLQSWLDGVQGRGVSAHTVDGYWRTARAMLRWAIERGLCPDPGLGQIEHPQLPRRVKATFGVEECRRALWSVGDPYHLQAALMLLAGLRSTECRRALWEQGHPEWRLQSVIVWADQAIRVSGKGGRVRWVPIQSELRAVLELYRRDQGPLFDRAVQYRARTQQTGDLRRFLGRLGIPVAGRSTHSWRHTYGSLMTALDVSSLRLMHLMGHGSVSTTEQYARSADRYLGAVEGWPRGEARGEFRLLAGGRSRLRDRPPALQGDDVADLVRQALRRLGWTQRRLAAAAGVSTATVSWTLSGRQAWTRPRARQWAQLLELDAEERRRMLHLVDERLAERRTPCAS